MTLRTYHHWALVLGAALSGCAPLAIVGPADETESGAEQPAGAGKATDEGRATNDLEPDDDEEGDFQGDQSGGKKAAGDGPRFAEPTKGSAAALSEDALVGLVANRDTGSVTVLQLAAADGDHGPEIKATEELDVGAGSEPFQVAIGPSGDRGYVVLRQGQELLSIEQLNGKPKVGARVAVGSEPTGLVLSPAGDTAYVANWNDGTVTVVDTVAMRALRSIDLNAALVDTGYLGDVQPRPALAHPRSLALSNDHDGESSDETLYVTEYFGQQVVPEDETGSRADALKVGVVYAVSLRDDSVRTIPLSPLADMGFADNNGDTAGCFPNQLQDIALHEGYAYVLSVCASPRGPIGFKTNTAPLLSVFELTSEVEVSAGGQSLNKLWFDLYEAEGVPDDASRRMPLLANDIAFVPGTNVGYVTAGGTDAVFRFELGADGTIDKVGASTNLFINLAPAALDRALAGQRPVGLAISAAAKRTALVVNDVSRSATLLDFNTQAVAGLTDVPQAVATAARPAEGSPEEAARRGKRFFTTGLARWSLNGQGWGACESCHTDGLTDNVTWYFPTGPRQSVAMDGTFASHDPEDQRILNWTAVRDEIHDFELNTRNVSGGVGAGVDTISDPLANTDRIDLAAVGAANLNGSAADAMDPSNPLQFEKPPLLNDWNEITAWVQTIRTPRRPTELDPELVAAGKEIFQHGGCAGCHSGAKWTISRRFYTPSAEVNADLLVTPFAVPDAFPLAILPALDEAQQLLRFQNADLGLDQIQCANREVGTFGVAENEVGIAELRQDMSTVAQGNGDGRNGRGYNVPSLLGIGAGAPYFHAGGARTLEAAFAEPFATHARALSPNLLTETDAQEREYQVSALVSYLLSIDEDLESLNVPPAGALGGELCAFDAQVDPQVDQPAPDAEQDGAAQDWEEPEQGGSTEY